MAWCRAFRRRCRWKPNDGSAAAPTGRHGPGRAPGPISKVTASPPHGELLLRMPSAIVRPKKTLSSRFIPGSRNDGLTSTGLDVRNALFRCESAEQGCVWSQSRAICRSPQQRRSYASQDQDQGRRPAHQPQRHGPLAPTTNRERRRPLGAFFFPSAPPARAASA